MLLGNPSTSTRQWVHSSPPLILLQQLSFTQTFPLGLETESLSCHSVYDPYNTKLGEKPQEPQKQLETDKSLSFSFWAEKS